MFPVFYSPQHARHAPSFEIFDGGERVPSYETPQRAERILSALRESGDFSILPPGDFGLEPILAVHSGDYVDFLRTAYAEWQNQARESAREALLPATFALPGWRRKPKSLLGRAGYYMNDLSAPITAGTWEAAFSAAQSAISAASSLTSGAKTAYALCRPPGHHASRSGCAGYCYLNNAAIAANWLSARAKVAVLDIDYHAGNGTQEIFYRRPDVLTLSLHADPEEEYPYFMGYATENGSGPGLGFHENFPLPPGTGDDAYLDTLERALERIREFEPGFLVVSAGMDIYGEDALGQFSISRAGIAAIGAQIAALRLPTALMQEGGYNTEALGRNVLALLRAFV